MTDTLRIKARRAGKAKVLTFCLPARMSRALPEGGHEFDVAFTETGIQPIKTPNWAQS